MQLTMLHVRYFSNEHALGDNLATWECRGNIGHQDECDAEAPEKVQIAGSKSAATGDYLK